MGRGEAWRAGPWGGVAGGSWDHPRGSQTALGQEKMLWKSSPGHYSRRLVGTGVGAFSTAESAVAATMGLGT